MAKKEKPTRESVRKKAEEIVRKTKPVHAIGDAVIAALPPMLFVGGEQEYWRYDEGRWKLVGVGKSAHTLLVHDIVRIGTNLDASFQYKDTRPQNDAIRDYIMTRPALTRREVAWDSRGGVVLANGRYDVATRKLVPHEPEDHTTRFAPVEYHAGAKCPLWRQFLGDMFDQQTIDMLQEAYGMAFFQGEKSKELSRAMLFHGPSDSGKTQLLTVLVGLLASEYITTPLSQLEGAHGTSEFWRNIPWVLQEAFEQNKWHFSSIVKLILEGECINVNRKNRAMLTVRYTAPSLWATNHPPAFKDVSRAVINRLLIISCNKVFDPRNITGVAKIALDKGYQKPSSLLLAEEGPGILNWAMEGMHRALERGYINMTKETEEALEQVHRDSNLVASWVADGYVTHDPHVKCNPADAHAAFSVFNVEQRGVGHSFSRLDFIKVLKSLNHGFKFGEELRSNGIRYVGGLRMSAKAIEDWGQAKNKPELFGAMILNVSDNANKINIGWKADAPPPRVQKKRATVRT
jgi:P4 family phage/plasmid primase-like protien